MPSLTNVTLPHAFESVRVIRINSILFEVKWWIDAGELIEHPGIVSAFHPTVHSVDELNAVVSNVESITVDGCNDASLTVLNLTQFVHLKELEVNDDSLSSVNEVYLIGLPELERVMIGMNSFTKYKNSWGNDSTRHFYLKVCPQLKELMIGRYSFSDYSVIEIENVERLEVIEMGEMNEWSYNFRYASLELKSDIDALKWWIDLSSLKSVLFGSSAFNDCSRAVFESD